MSEPSLSLPAREGSRPTTTDTNPHTQLEQNPSAATYEKLAARMRSVPGTTPGPSRISVPGAIALILDDDIKTGPRSAFIVDRECCHLHPPDDGSLHMTLPLPIAQEARELGWAEQHPVAMRGMIPETVVMVYAPRDSDEIDSVMALVEHSVRFARGDSPNASE